MRLEELLIEAARANVEKFAEDMRGICISTAYELRPGATYMLKCDFILSGQARQAAVAMVKEWEAVAGCKFIVIDKHLNLVEPPDGA